MKLYLAPLEGLGGYVYRNAQADLFAPADKYFSPFLSPGSKKRLTPRALREVAPEHNRNVRLVPQIMTNDARAFTETAMELAQLGYGEVNLNLGCPSRTVVSKGRGAGFLADPDALDGFLDVVFDRLDAVRISAKTRIGVQDPGEFSRLLEIFNRYPFSELIIHPRVQTDFYRNHPRLEVFSEALAKARMPVVYNGDLFSAAAVDQFAASYPSVRTVMIGRGVLCNPALFGEIRGQDTLTKEQLWAFHERLLTDFSETLSGDHVVLIKMKELWHYMICDFADAAKYAKEIQKAQKLADYRGIVRRLFEDGRLINRQF